MNEFDTGIITSSLVLNYLLRTKSNCTLYLEDGVKLSGILLGWDNDFLLIKEGKFLHMVQAKKVLRLQAEIDQITGASENTLENPNHPFVESNRPNSFVVGSVPKFKPTLTEVKAPAAIKEADDSEAKNDYKDKLDQLVKNW